MNKDYYRLRKVLNRYRDHSNQDTFLCAEQIQEQRKHREYLYQYDVHGFFIKLFEYFDPKKHLPNSMAFFQELLRKWNDTNLNAQIDEKSLEEENFIIVANDQVMMNPHLRSSSGFRRCNAFIDPKLLFLDQYDISRYTIPLFSRGVLEQVLENHNMNRTEKLPIAYFLPNDTNNVRQTYMLNDTLQSGYLQIYEAFDEAFQVYLEGVSENDWKEDISKHYALLLSLSSLDGYLPPNWEKNIGSTKIRILADYVVKKRLLENENLKTIGQVQFLVRLSNIPYLLDGQDIVSLKPKNDLNSFDFKRKYSSEMDCGMGGLAEQVQIITQDIQFSLNYLFDQVGEAQWQKILQQGVNVAAFLLSRRLNDPSHYHRILKYAYVEIAPFIIQNILGIQSLIGNGQDEYAEQHELFKRDLLKYYIERVCTNTTNLEEKREFLRDLLGELHEPGSRFQIFVYKDEVVEMVVNYLKQYIPNVPDKVQWLKKGLSTLNPHIFDQYEVIFEADLSNEELAKESRSVLQEYFEFLKNGRYKVLSALKGTRVQAVRLALMHMDKVKLATKILDVDQTQELDDILGNDKQKKYDDLPEGTGNDYYEALQRIRFHMGVLLSTLRDNRDFSHRTVILNYVVEQFSKLKNYDYSSFPPLSLREFLLDKDAEIYKRDTKNSAFHPDDVLSFQVFLLQKESIIAARANAQGDKNAFLDQTVIKSFQEIEPRLSVMEIILFQMVFHDVEPIANYDLTSAYKKAEGFEYIHMAELFYQAQFFIEYGDVKVALKFVDKLSEYIQIKGLNTYVRPVQALRMNAFLKLAQFKQAREFSKNMARPIHEQVRTLEDTRFLQRSLARDGLIFLREWQYEKERAETGGLAVPSDGPSDGNDSSSETSELPLNLEQLLGESESSYKRFFAQENAPIEVGDVINYSAVLIWRKKHQAAIDLIESHRDLYSKQDFLLNLNLGAAYAGVDIYEAFPYLKRATDAYDSWENTAEYSPDTALIQTLTDAIPDAARRLQGLGLNKVQSDLSNRFLSIIRETEREIEGLDISDEEKFIVSELGDTIDRLSQKPRQIEDCDEDSSTEWIVSKAERIFEENGLVLTTQHRQMYAAKKEGELDIHVSKNGKTIMVGENKVWGGAQQFRRQFSQLLSYMTPLCDFGITVIFNRGKGSSLPVPSLVVRKMRIENLKNFSAEMKDGVRVFEVQGEVLRASTFFPEGTLSSDVLLTQHRNPENNTLFRVYHFLLDLYPYRKEMKEKSEKTSKDPLQKPQLPSDSVDT